MKIEQLPVEILMEIFSYLPSYSYNSVSLVNKYFYNVTCTVNDPNNCLTLNKWFFKNEKKLQLLQSIKKSNRKISKMSIEYGNPTASQVQSAISIIEKFGTTITFLEICGFTLRMSDFLEILSLVPNVKEMRLNYVVELPTSSEPLYKKRRLLGSDEDLNLHMLKKLKLEHSNPEIISVFNRLPVGVLSELECDRFKEVMLRLHTLFKRQTNLKKITLLRIYLFNESIDVPEDIFDCMKLERLMWNVKEYNQNNVAKILSKQTKLEYLELSGEILNEGLMNAVANHLIELKSLSVEIPETSTAPFVSAFVNMIKLKKLKMLTLSDFGMFSTTFELFKLDFTHITTLKLKVWMDMEVDRVNLLARSVPNLKTLELKCSLNDQILNAILKTFNFVEVLVIKNWNPYIRCTDSNRYLFQGDCFNPKLIDLTIKCSIDESPTQLAFLEKLIDYYPNLQKLAITASSTLTVELFKTFLNSFTKMESLSLLFEKAELTSNDFQYLKNQMKNLKFFYSCNYPFDFQLIAQLKHELRAIFHEVDNFVSDFAIAINRNTMKREKELLELRILTEL